MWVLQVTSSAPVVSNLTQRRLKRSTTRALCISFHSKPCHSSVAISNETGYTLEMGAGRTESGLRIERGPGRKRSHVILRSTKVDWNHCWCKPRWSWCFFGRTRQSPKLCKSGVKWCWRSLLPDRARDACCSVGSRTFPSFGLWSFPLSLITSHSLVFQ